MDLFASKDAVDFIANGFFTSYAFMFLLLAIMPVMLVFTCYLVKIRYEIKPRQARSDEFLTGIEHPLFTAILAFFTAIYFACALLLQSLLFPDFAPAIIIMLTIIYLLVCTIARHKGLEIKELREIFPEERPLPPLGPPRLFKHDIRAR